MTSVPETASSDASVDVPFIDLRSSFEQIQEGVLSDLSASMSTGAFTNGPAVAEFERAFADYVGVTECVGLASGLDALRLGLEAMEIGSGDEVLVPAATFIATWEAVSQTGAVPVPVDVTPADYCVDPLAAEAAIGERTRAIIPVHLYGQLADPHGLSRLRDEYGLQVLEDACQAHGASRGGAVAGTVGRAAAFSFYPSKNLGAMGDAGALVTSDPAVATKVRGLREHGQEEKYTHRSIGWTARLDTIQAAALLRKLPLLDGWNAERRAVARWYGAAFAGLGDLTLPPVADESDPVWYVYVVTTPDPLALAAHLQARGISTGRHYPEPIHLSDAYASLGHREGAFPVAERLARQCLSLPMFPGISERQLEAVAAGVRSWFDRG